MGLISKITSTDEKPTDECGPHARRGDPVTAAQGSGVGTPMRLQKDCGNVTFW